jgi:hypothetical protein
VRRLIRPQDNYAVAQTCALADQELCHATYELGIGATFWKATA